MISRVKGTLLTREPGGTVEVETAGGVVYELQLPLTVLQRLPSPPAAVELRTLQVVRADSVALYGFLEALERALFRRLLDAPGVGVGLALQMLSSFTASRLARALAEKDVNALRQVKGLGKKKAEKVALELWDKVADLAVTVPEGADGAPAIAQEAVATLVALGYVFADADAAVRSVLEDGGAESAEALVRKALESR